MSRVEVHDGVFDAALLAEAAAAWPVSAEWSHWFGYDSPLERKRTCAEWAAIPRPCARLLAELAAWASSQYAGLVADTSLYGAGLCDMRAGDFLSLHQDHDRHPHLGLTRLRNAVLFVGDAVWRRHWGGELEVWDGGRESPSVAVLPAPGRVVLFEPSLPHAVAPVTGPEPRRALSIYLYGLPWLPPAAAQRPRARFLAATGEPPAAELERLRRERGAAAERREG